jgi:ankyrin repeat protein
VKPDRISLIIKWLLVAGLILALLPCLAPAKDTAKLDKELVEAAARGDVAQVKALLDKGANINAKLNGRTALMQAAWNQHIDVMRLLTKRGADIRAKDYAGYTAGNLFIKARDLEVARQRRELGAQLTLDEAAKRGDVQAVQRLLRQGIDVNDRDWGRTPLMTAALKGHLDIVKLLIKKGADIHARDLEGKTALYLAALRVHTKVATFLRKHGAQLDFVTAIRLGDLREVQRLVKEGADVNSKDIYGGTPLMIAAGTGNLEIVRLLLDNGADINATRDGSDATALMNAVKGSNVEVVKLLIEKGADVNTVVEMGDENMTAMDFAAISGNVEILKMLIEKDAHFNGALAIAAGKGHVEAVKLLIDKGADVNAGGWWGETALMIAAGAGQLEAMKLLIEKGAKVNAQNKNGKTALWYAVLFGGTEAAELLIENGAVPIEKKQSP